MNRKKRSLIWQFVRACHDDKTCHECNLCHDIIVADNNTSNSRRHLEENHPKVWAKALQRQRNEEEGLGIEIEMSDESSANENGSTLSVTVDSVLLKDNSLEKTSKKKKSGRCSKLCLKRQIKYGKKHPKKLKMDQDLLRMIAEDFQPYSIVERRAFKRLMNMADPRYKLPDRTTISKIMMPKLYIRVENLLRDRLAVAKYELILLFELN